MALQLTTSINVYGKQLVFEHAYIKVETLHGNKQSLTFSADYFSEKGGQLFKRQDFTFEHQLENQNAIAQAYEHLKTLPEFEGAVDC